MATGEEIPLPESAVIGGPIDRIERITFAVGSKGNVAFLLHTSGDGEVVVLDEVPERQIPEWPVGRVAFWPGTGNGSAISDGLAEAGPTLGLGIISVDSYESVDFGPGEDPSVAVVRFAPPDANSSDPPKPSLIVRRDGTTVDLRAPIANVAFSPDPGTSALVLSYTDDLSDIWDHASSRSIGTLGLGVGTTEFDAAGDRLVVRYLTGATYVLDLQRLRTLPRDLTALSDADFETLVCRTLGDQAATLAPVACGSAVAPAP